MISNAAIVLLVGLTVCVCPRTLAAEENELAVDITTKSGKSIQIPFFSPELKTLDPELKERLVGDTREMLSMVGGTLIGRLTAKKSAFSALQGGYAWTKLATQIGLVARGQEATQLASAKRILGTRKAFNNAMLAIFVRAQEASKKIDMNDQPKQPRDLAKEVDIFVQDFIEIIEASPVACYLDWSQATFDGELFEQHLAKLMAKLSHNGYSPVFSSIEMLLSLLVKLTGGSKSAN